MDVAERHATRPCLYPRGATAALSYQEVLARAAAIAGRLIDAGMAPGDHVMLAGENGPDWVTADLGILLAGGVSVPAYATNSPDDHAYILDHSNAKALLCSPVQAVKLAPLLAERKGLPGWSWGGGALSPLEDGPLPSLDTLRRRSAGRGPDSLAAIIYTSGTGGRPKGVMVPHRAVMAILSGATEILASLGLGKERFLCFLPLSHAYEHVAGLFWPLFLGAEIYFAGSPERMIEDFQRARPTIMTAVPRLYEVLRDRIEARLRKAPRWRRALFRATVRLGEWKYDRRLPLSFYPVDAVLDITVRRQIRRLFGGALKAFISGGAALDPALGRYFLALGVHILQGYGQTESCPVISVNRPDDNRIATVGQPLPGVSVRIAEDGEILARGANLMTGYWRDEAATAQALAEGWLHTGDIGTLDQDGFLCITDRKKDIIVLSGGDTISPLKLELALCAEEEIAQAVVFGDGKAHCGALLVPSEENRQAWRDKHGSDPFSSEGALAVYRGVIDQAVTRVNRKLGQNEQIRRYHLLGEPFTIANGLLTPTLKTRRHKIIARYKNEIDALF